MLYQYNVQTNSLISPIGKTGAGGVGARISNVPEITFSTAPEWTIQFCSVDNGNLVALDLSEAAAWRATIDNDYNPETEPMCRSLPDQIDHSAAAEGKIKIRLNANTAAFLAAVRETRSSDAWLELWGLDTKGHAIHYCKFKIRALMALDPASGAEPESIEELWADRAWVEARFREIEIPEQKLSNLSDVDNAASAGHGQALVFNAQDGLWKPGTIEKTVYTAGDGIRIAGHEISADTTLARQATIDAALTAKVDKIPGKGLSVNDYDNAAKNKLDNLAPVAVSGSYDDLLDKPAIPENLADLSGVSGISTATDGQALLYDAATEQWKPGSVSSASSTGVAVITVDEPDSNSGTIQVRPVKVNADGTSTWDGPPVTALYTWAPPVD